MFRDIFDMDREFKKLREQMDRVFGDQFGGALDEDRKLLGSGSQGGPVANAVRTPLSDVYETEDEVVASIELPGVDKKDIKVDVSNGMLNVKAEKKYENKDEDEKRGYHRYERSYTGFYRSFPVPSNVDENGVKAKYNEGMLEVHMPKKEEKEEDNKKYIDVE